MSSPPLPLDPVVNDHDIPVFESRSKAPKRQNAKQRRDIRKKATAIVKTSPLIAKTQTMDLQIQIFDLTIQTRQDKTCINRLQHDQSRLTKLAATLRSDIAFMHSKLDGLKSQLDFIAVSKTFVQQPARSCNSFPPLLRLPCGPSLMCRSSSDLSCFNSTVPTNPNRPALNCCLAKQ